MSGDLRSAFITLALSLPAIVLCLSIHEAAHGGAAYLRPPDALAAGTY